MSVDRIVMQSGARYVIAGGSGLIGSRLSAALCRAGAEVVVLSRSPADASLPDGVRPVRWDGRTVGAWAEEVDGADVVVNLAGANVGEGRWTEARKRTLRASRVEPTRAIVEAIGRARHRPRVLAQGSAIGFYGDRGDELLTEDAARGRGFLPDLCRDWEVASVDAESLGTRRVLLRSGIVLAREGGALPKMLLPFRLGLGGPLGDGRQWFPWIHLDDAVSAIRCAVDDERLSGPVHLVAPNPVTNAELTRALGRACRRPALLRVPAVVLRLFFGEMAEVLLGGQRAVPERLSGAGFGFAHPRIDGALGALLGRGR